MYSPLWDYKSLYSLPFVSKLPKLHVITIIHNLPLAALSSGQHRSTSTTLKTTNPPPSNKKSHRLVYQINRNTNLSNLSQSVRSPTIDRVCMETVQRGCCPFDFDFINSPLVFLYVQRHDKKDLRQK